MPLPANRVDTVRVPNDTTTYNIVPSSLQDGSGKHSIATPTTTKDTTLVVGVKINNVTKEPTNGIVDLGTFQDGLDGDQLAAVNSGITADKVTKYEGYETKINSNTTEITTIKETLKSGVTFKGTVTGDELPPATDYNNGDLIIFGKKEYICFDKGTSKEWIELGDEGTHLTKTMADIYYVPYSGATKDINLGEHSATVKNIVANGTTKLGGGFEPIKSYTVNADYRGTQTTLVLNVFTENYVESSKMYSFFGSASATVLGVGEFICNGSYRLDTNGNLDSAVLLTTMKQDIGSLIMACQYENGQLIAVNLAFYDDIESVQTWANGTFAQLGNPNNFRSSNVFNGNLIANGTLKLTGGFEPIKTYTVDGTYQENPLSVTLNIFTEKRGVVDSASNPPTTTYSFYGSANAPSLGGEIIGQGVYFLNTNNNTIYSLLFVCGLNTYSLDGDTGEFKFDTIPQGTGVDNYVENYVKNTLDGMISKDSSGKIAVGRGITVEADGNVAVKKSLEVSETTKLLGGLEPVATYLNTYKSDNDVRVYDFGILNKDKTEYGTDNAHLLVFVSRPLSEEGAKRSLSLVGFGKLDVSPQKILNSVEMAGNDISGGNDATGTQTFVSLIYRPSDEIFSIKTVEGALTEIKGDIPNNIKDGTGANSIQENQDGTGGKFDFSGKNPNAFSFDATLNGQLDYGALGAFSSSFGGKGQARGKRSFQVGTTTIAYGNYTFASGSDSVAMGPASHVEGYSNTTGPTADSSHAEGGENLVTSNRGHVEGYKNTVKGMNGHGEGENVLVTENAEAGHAEGTNTKANNLSAHAEGQQTEANGINSHSENTLTRANGDSSHAEGYGNEVNSYAGHIEGSGNKILNTLPSSGGGDTPGPSPTDPDDPTFNINEHLGYNSHVEGSLNISYGYNSHTEGTKNTTFGHYAHTEGSGNKNYGTNNHMEGSQNKMSDTAAVAITNSHIEGTNNNVTNPCSNLHIGGVSNTGGADGAYVMGHNNDVSSTAKYSATFGKGLKTTDEDTIVLGTYNKVQQGTGRMLVIGNGTSDTARKNAVEIMRDGRVKISKAPEENDDAVRLWELHSKQDVIYGAQADALNSTINKTKVNKYEGYEAKIDAASQKMVSITYDDLVTARNSKDLVPGMNYRITDYTAVISPGSVTEKSAGHQFDLIVTADGPDTLNENARAILHEGDTYFKDCDLNSWRLKYCLDNDRSRFYWAYEKGKGVIYWMEDEFHNQVPYDFKNIMFKRYKVKTVGKNTPVSFDSFFNGTGNLSLTDCISPVKTSAIGDVASDTSIWCYTFCTFENNDPTIPLDASLNLFPDGIVAETPRLLSFLHAFDNVIEPLIVCSPSIETTKKNYQRLNNIVFMKYDKDTSVDTKDNFRVYGNRFSSSSQNITLGRKCYYNTFNGNNVGLMVGYGCAENTFTTCGNTAIAYNCSGNIFNSRFRYNLVFNNCKNNSFGMKCQYLELGENSSFNTFEDDISYVRLVADATGTEPLQYVTVSKGVKGTGSGAGMLHLSQPRGLTHTVTYRRVQSETIDV